MIYEKLTPWEYLGFVAGLWGVDTRVAAARAHDLLAALGLAPHGGERCERLSKGMRQKVAMAGALVHAPQLIILDEPFTGLDAGSARVVKEVLRERVQDGCSVIMTTHILDVAERMADRIGVMSTAGWSPRARWMRCGRRQAPATPAWRTPFSPWSRRTRPPRDTGTISLVRAARSATCMAGLGFAHDRRSPPPGAYRGDWPPGVRDCSCMAWRG